MLVQEVWSTPIGTSEVTGISLLTNLIVTNQIVDHFPIIQSSETHKSKFGIYLLPLVA